MRQRTLLSLPPEKTQPKYDEKRSEKKEQIHKKNHAKKERTGRLSERSYDGKRYYISNENKMMKAGFQRFGGSQFCLCLSPNLITTQPMSLPVFVCVYLLCYLLQHFFAVVFRKWPKLNRIQFVAFGPQPASSTQREIRSI